MDPKEFANSLNHASKLIEEEKYTEALDLLDQLKNIDKKNDLNYNLIHRLYQLDSNAHSLYNQQLILKHLNNIAKNQKSISFHELNIKLQNSNELNISDEILRREIELLILRNLISCAITNNTIIFKSS